jgi:outer membrane protein TolC
VVALVVPAQARAGVGGAPAPPLPTDPVLARLVEESLAARPELRQADAAAAAERERIPQAGALPDPTLSLSIENEGFSEITVGEMEASFYQVMLSQGLPWPGKRGLRTDVARLAAREAETGVARARLTAEADVRRGYLDLLLARDRLRLLAQLETIWQRSSGLARARYESGEGAQSDVLRAQLEQNRLRQRRALLETSERTAVQTLNRLRARPLDEPIETGSTVRGMGAPALPPVEAAVEDALRRSPELARARAGAARAERAAALARRERFPDLAVTAGVMPRGDLTPMWQAGVSIGLPVWTSRKQGRAVSETRARAEGEAAGAEGIEQLLRLRVVERLATLEALLGNITLYRDGLLVQSQATVDSTLAQYRVGRVTFASVLEANAGFVGDEDGYLSALAEAQRLAIAGFELSLDPAAVGATGLGGAAMPGAGAAGGPPRTSGAAASAAGAPGAGAASGGAMGGGM